MSVQSFITIKWQEKKLLIIKLFKFFVSDHLELMSVVLLLFDGQGFMNEKTNYNGFGSLFVQFSLIF